MAREDNTRDPPSLVESDDSVSSNDRASGDSPKLCLGESPVVRPGFIDSELSLETTYGGYSPQKVGAAVHESAHKLCLELPDYIAALVPTFLAFQHVIGFSAVDRERGTQVSPRAPPGTHIYLEGEGNCRVGPWLKPGQSASLKMVLGSPGASDGWMFGVGVARRDYIWDRHDFTSNRQFLKNSAKRFNYFCAHDGRSMLYHGGRMMPLPLPAAKVGETLELFFTGDRKLFYNVAGTEPFELPIEIDEDDSEWCFLMQVYALSIKLSPPRSRSRKRKKGAAAKKKAVKRKLSPESMDVVMVDVE